MVGSKVVGLLLLALASAEWFWGNCPKPRAITNFDFDSYAGKWYTVLMSKDQDVPKRYARCPRTYLSKTVAADEERFYRAEIMSLVNNTYITYNKHQYFDQPSGEGILSMCDHDQTNCNNWTILDTDYRTYAVTWACEDTWHGLWHDQIAYVNARKINFNGRLAETPIITATNLKSTDLEEPNNAHCPADNN